MKHFQLPQKPKSPAVKLEILGTVSQIFSPSKQSVTKKSALLMVAGVGLSFGMSASAIGSTSSSIFSLQGKQLISQKSNSVQLNLVSFSVTQAAYEKIIPQFVAKWKQEKGQDVVIKQSYGASGSQAKAVVDGLEADVVGLSLALDVKTIQDAGLIQPGWDRELPNGGIVTRSVVALETRPGNPKNIQTWADLVKPGIKVITPDPKTSGLGRWNFLTLWGTVTQRGGNEDKAREYVSQVYKNAPVLPKSAREATELFFKKGQGDVLVNYENEVIWAKKTGQGKSTYVVPKVNISIDNPVAIVDKNVDKHGTREVAKAFAEYLFTPQAQREFVKLGFRPVEQTVAREVEKQFPKVDQLFSVVDLGGWNRVQKKFFDDKAIFDQIQSKNR